MTSRVAVALLVLTVSAGALVVGSCDSAPDSYQPDGDSDTPPDSAIVHFDLVGGLLSSGDWVDLGTGACRFTPCLGCPHRGLDEGELQLHPDGVFDLTFVGRRYPYDTSPAETLRVDGTTERIGALVRLRTVEYSEWPGTVGPDAGSPTTVVLAQRARGSGKGFYSNQCNLLVFSLPGQEPRRWVNAVGHDSASFRLTKYGPSDMPYWGRFSNSYTQLDSARLDFTPFGRYRVISWWARWTYPDPYPGTTESQETGGWYFSEDSVYVIDPGAGSLTFGFVTGDDLRVLNTVWFLSHPYELAFQRRR